MVPEPAEKCCTTDTKSYWWLELAVPLFSFGGALLAILFWTSDSAIDFRITILGCVIASWVLAYLAWIRPKKRHRCLVDADLLIYFHRRTYGQFFRDGP